MDLTSAAINKKKPKKEELLGLESIPHKPMPQAISIPHKPILLESSAISKPMPQIGAQLDSILSGAKKGKKTSEYEAKGEAAEEIGELAEEIQKSELPAATKKKYYEILKRRLDSLK